MTRIEVMFLKDGLNYGYLYKADTKGMVYESDLPYLIANGVIEAPIQEEPKNQIWPHLEKRSFWERLKFWK